MCLREKILFVLKKSAGFAENDVRVPPTNLVGAFLKYGKLEAAEPCGATDQCSLIQPAIQFSKNFLFDDIEWVDEFLDPGIATTIGKMDNISERVNTSLLSGSTTFWQTQTHNSMGSSKKNRVRFAEAPGLKPTAAPEPASPEL